MIFGFVEQFLAGLG